MISNSIANIYFQFYNTNRKAGTSSQLNDTCLFYWPFCTLQPYLSSLISYFPPSAVCLTPERRSRNARLPLDLLHSSQRPNRTHQSWSVSLPVTDTVLVKLPMVPDLVQLIQRRMLSLRHTCHRQRVWHWTALFTRPQTYQHPLLRCEGLIKVYPVARISEKRSRFHSRHCGNRPNPFDSCSHPSVRPCWSVNRRGPWVISQLLFSGYWSDEPLEWRRHWQTGPGRKLMRNRRAWGRNWEGVQEVDVLEYVDCEWRQLCFLFVRIRLTDLYLVSLGL